MRSRIYYFLGFILLFLAGCGKLERIFVETSPHDDYRKVIITSGLAETDMGKRWLEAAEAYFDSSSELKIPYKETGRFKQDEVKASVYKIGVRQGEVITIEAEPDSGAPAFFVDLFNEKRERVAFSKLNDPKIVYEVKETGDLLLRVQPELLQSVTYLLTVTPSPSLAFPVENKDSRAIGSFWGAQRDGGRRSHQGVDIFAPKGTPVLASANGVISRTGTNNLGGKVVWLSTLTHSLYYAHLDSQYVSPGMRVSIGDTLGVVGNTGNAKTTPPHLHFGIYYRGKGAVDPLPYIKNIYPEPRLVTKP
jgi:peptidoglycan LD-endopeptidase LytH